MTGLYKLFESSTFWAGLVWAGLWAVSNANGMALPIEVLYVMTGIYGAKEIGKSIASRGGRDSA